MNALFADLILAGWTADQVGEGYGVTAIEAQRRANLHSISQRGSVADRRIWCGQCDRRVLGNEALVCASPFCAAQAHLAEKAA